ncbi:hypothetical protein K1719_017742 [Acacia pycnantha]|nr:hypothetical protein K1719_017742 [Acacia pycnantha]
MLPPHEIVARGSRVSPKTTSLVLEGVGRTLIVSSTLYCMCTRSTTNPEGLLGRDPEIERTILAARRAFRLSHWITTEFDTKLDSDSEYSDCVHSVDLSSGVSDSVSGSVYIDSSSNFANSEIIVE